MSKWTDVRDSIENDIKVSGIDEAVKQKLLGELTNEAMPAAECAVDKLCDGLRTDSEGEDGWCKVRDAVVLPCALRGLVWLCKLGLGHTLQKTA